MNVLPSSQDLISSIVLVMNIAACGRVDHVVGSQGKEASGNGAETGNGNTGSDGVRSILDDCTVLRDDSDEDSCQVEVECDDSWVSSNCNADADALECDCGNIRTGVTFRLPGVEPANGCSHALAACLTWPELEAEPYVCTPLNEAVYPGYCNLDAECTREGVIGEVRFTELHQRQTDCNGPDDGTGWTCGCGSVTEGSWHFATPTSEPQCVDGLRWCVGEDVERVGSRTCTSMYETIAAGICVIELECQRPVTASGQAATVLTEDLVACRLGD